MNGVPGVMQLESKWCSFGFSGGRMAPFVFNSSRIRATSVAFSAASFDARKRRDLCWFILARGAEDLLLFFVVKDNSKALIDYPSLTDTVNCHIENFSWSNNRHEAINAVKNCHHHLIFIPWRRFIFRMSAETQIKGINSKSSSDLNFLTMDV